MSNASQSRNEFQSKTDKLDKGKNFVNTIYEQSLDTISQVEDNIKEYSGKVVAGVKHYPVTTLLLAGGISVLLTLLLRKR